MPGAEEDLDGNRRALEPVLLADPFAESLGAEVTGWGGGWARAQLRVGAQHTNLAGIVHGGVTFALGDVVFGVSSNSWGRLAVALTVEVQYLNAVAAGALLIAESRERHRTKRTAAYLLEVRSPSSDIEVRSPSSDIEARSPSSDIEVRSPSSDIEARSPSSDVEVRSSTEAGGTEQRLVASLHALVHRTDRWHLGEQAWSDDWRASH